MTATPPRALRGPGGKNAPVITDASTGASQELALREKRYAITMAFRTACFLSMIFVPGPFRWVLFGCAVCLPYVAVVFANQANVRGRREAVVPGAPADAPAISTGPAPEVIPGTVEDDFSAHRQDRVA